MSLLFSATLFLSAFLLFVVQPLVAKMLLPVLGGSPAVWTTCMLFFQAALLAGYFYAHLGSSRLPWKWQALGQVGLLGLGFLALRLDVDRVATPDASAEPAAWLLGQLAVSIGLPFVLLAASAPLLQRWYAASGRDPYFLYAASNAGSLAGLAAFPFMLEPLQEAEQQILIWTIGYGLLIVLTGLCSLASLLREGEAPAEPASQNPAARQAIPEDLVQPARQEPRPPGLPGVQDPICMHLATSTGGLRPPLALARRLRWALLAFIPSSLMLGVTATITTDIAAVPLLWVIPLGLYLLSFVIVFRATGAALPFGSRPNGLLPFAVLAGVALLAMPAFASWYLVPLHWLVLFVVALACHGRLAEDRPEPERLTEFYLWLAAGGVLGGLFNVFAAPLLFRGSHLEYPLVLLLAGFFRPGPGLRDSPSLARWLDLLLPGLLFTAVLGLALGLHAAGHKPGPLAVLAILCGAAAVCGSFAARPTRFTLALLALFFVRAAPGGMSRTLAVERNFFGIVRVQEVRDEQGQRYRQLVHGSTIHGRQRLDDDGNLVRHGEPLAYFHPSGPVGRVLEAFHARHGPPSRIGVAGLGVGSLSAYGRAGEEWTFYEIDPAVARMAVDYFTYLEDCPAGRPRLMLGDARLQLQGAPDGHFSLLVLDAFSSDSVPVHLLTREALAIYRRKLAPGGILAFNVTNRYLDLRPVLADLAREAGWECFARVDQEATVSGKSPSAWLVMAEKPDDLGPIAGDPRWQRLPGREGARVWTDRFSNLIGVLRWGRDY